MKEIFQAIRDNNLNYVSNNLRFIKFSNEEFHLALLLSPTDDMNRCLIKGAKMDQEEAPYQQLFKFALSENITALMEILNSHSFDKKTLQLILEQSKNSLVKKMISLSLQKL